MLVLWCRFKYFSIGWLTFVFTRWPARSAESTTFFSLINYRSGFLVENRSLKIAENFTRLILRDGFLFVYIIIIIIIIMSAASTDIPDPLSPLLPIVHRFWQVSWLHPVSSHSCCMYVRAGRPAFARPYVGVHRSTSLMSSSLLLQKCPACLVRLTLIVFAMRGRWPYSWCFVRCCLQDLFNIARSILVQLPSSFFSSRFVSVQVVHPYISMDTTAAWKKLRFILSVMSDFHMIDSLSIAVHAFVSRVLMSFSVDETLLPFVYIPFDIIITVLI